MQLDPDLLALWKLACSQGIGGITRTGSFKGSFGSKYGSLFAKVPENLKGGTAVEILRPI